MDRQLRRRDTPHHNPADTRRIVGTFPASTSTDVDAAVAAARKRILPLEEQRQLQTTRYYYRVGQLLIDRKEQLATDMTREMGKCSKRLAATCRRPST